MIEWKIVLGILAAISLFILIGIIAQNMWVSVFLFVFYGLRFMSDL